MSGFDQSVATARAVAVTPPVIGIAHGDAATVSFKDLAVRLPNGVPLVNASDIAIGPGERVLVERPVRIRQVHAVPRAGRRLAVRRRHHRGAEECPRDDAAAAALFSDRALGRRGRLSGRTRHFDAARVAELVAAVGLPELAKRIEEEAHWNRMLSLGEQQRLGIARALLHAPDYLFLDEATASLDEPAEAALYQLLEQRLAGATIVSIGHRSTLAAFHRRRLAFSREGDRYWVARGQAGGGRVAYRRNEKGGGSL